MTLKEIEKLTKEKAIKAKDYVLAHKKAFAVGGLAAIGGIVYLVTRDKEENDDFKSLFRTAFTYPNGENGLAIDTVITHIGTEKTEFIRKIDEEIFTDLAPEIENYVCDNGIENAVSERSYDLGDNIHKLVTVTVKQVVGD